MGRNGAGLDRLKTDAPGWDRFAHWRRGPAMALLIALAVLIVLSALTLLTGSMDGEVASVPDLVVGGEAEDIRIPRDERDEDLALYDRIIERVAAGENYYRVAVEEQRAGNYPVRPGLAVRLPTLAYLYAWLGQAAMQFLGAAIVSAAAVAWWFRLGAGLAASGCAILLLLLLGAMMVVNRYYGVLHELWTGPLIALSLGLHRPGRWGPSLAVAAAALLLRELALPFVLLMGAMAGWRRDWREAAGWAVLIAAYAALLAWHLGQIEALVRPDDPIGPGWLTLDGLGGWLSKVVLASNLRFLPHWIAGPVALLMVLGWAGWKSPAGSTATLLCCGYALAFMIAGRANNFYWGAVIVPVLFMGLAFAPRSLRSLYRAARG